LLGSLRVGLAGVHAANSAQWGSAEAAAHSTETRPHGSWAESRGSNGTTTDSCTAQATAHGWVKAATYSTETRPHGSWAESSGSSGTTNSRTAEATADGWVKRARSCINNRAWAVGEAAGQTTGGTTNSRTADGWVKRARSSIDDRARAVGEAAGHATGNARGGAGGTTVAVEEAEVQETAGLVATVPFRRLVFAVVLGVGTLVKRQG